MYLLVLSCFLDGENKYSPTFFFKRKDAKAQRIFHSSLFTFHLFLLCLLSPF